MIFCHVTQHGINVTQAIVGEIHVARADEIGPPQEKDPVAKLPRREINFPDKA